jgi:hypothetical protein
LDFRVIFKLIFVATSLHHFFNYLYSVKALYFILALYVTALSVYPCSDENTCTDEKQMGEQIANASEHPHSANEKDLCTPFCICACCATHIRISYASSIDFAGVIHNTKETIPYIEKRVLSDYSHIWQPPKI